MVGGKKKSFCKPWVDAADCAEVKLNADSEASENFFFFPTTEMLPLCCFKGEARFHSEAGVSGVSGGGTCSG